MQTESRFRFLYNKSGPFWIAYILPKQNLVNNKIKYHFQNLCNIWVLFFYFQELVVADIKPKSKGKSKSAKKGDAPAVAAAAADSTTDSPAKTPAAAAKA